MTDGMSHLTLTICVAVLLLAAATGGAAGEGEPAAPQPPADQSTIWGPWFALPWDTESVAAPAWTEALNQPLDLTRRGRAGDRHHYRIRRVNLSVDREGQILNRMIAEADLTRTLVREVEPNLWEERCEWTRFATATGAGPDDYPTPQEFSDARGISFTFSPRTFDYVNAPADFTRVADPSAAYMLKVLTMDAMGWDSTLLSLRDAAGGAVRIGQTWREIAFQPWDITSASGQESVGQYHAGEVQTSIAGLTRFRGEPCVLIWFSMEGNVITQKMSSPDFALDMKATEYFRGEITASLVDGRVAAMEIWGPLPCVMKMGSGGEPPTEQPISAFIQQVSMYEVPAPPSPTSP